MSVPTFLMVFRWVSHFQSPGPKHQKVKPNADSGIWEHKKLPQWGLGQSPGCKQFLSEKESQNTCSEFKYDKYCDATDILHAGKSQSNGVWRTMLGILRIMGPLWFFGRGDWGGLSSAPTAPLSIPCSRKPASSTVFAVLLYVMHMLQGYRKHSLLREILPIIGAELRLQRLFSEYQQQLATATSIMTESLSLSWDWFHIRSTTASLWSMQPHFDIQNQWHRGQVLLSFVWAVVKLSENFPLVRKFASKNAKYEAVSLHFGKI